MTKDRIRALSHEELSLIAEQHGIHVFRHMDRESLATLVFEALDDDRRDREVDINTIIQVEAKKYTVSQDEELFLEFGEKVHLAERYGENRLVLMLRDPFWVYCYWDVEDRILEELSNKKGYAGLFLRISKLAAADWEGDSIVDWFDVPIQFSDLQRYINLPNEGAYYGVELGACYGEEKGIIARSNIVEGSRESIAPTSGGRLSHRDRLIALSGLSKAPESFQESVTSWVDNPQRVTSLGVDGEEGRLGRNTG